MRYDIKAILGDHGLAIFRRILIAVPVANLDPDGFDAPREIGDAIIDDIRSRMEED